MTIDMSQFLDIFYEESYEGLDVMESELLNLDIGTADEEVINTIFRAAHSIKGGSGTFGLDAVCSFTHVMETLLDEMRDGRRQVTQEAVNLLLSAVDVLREMLTALRSNSDLNETVIDATHKKLEALLGSGDIDNDRDGDRNKVALAKEGQQAGADDAQTTGWAIHFRPHSEMLKTGNDVVRIYRELSALGEFSVVADTSNLPSFEDLQVHDSYMAWDITVKGSGIGRDKIDELFSWVEDISDIEITPLFDVQGNKSEQDLKVGLLETSFNDMLEKADTLAVQFYERLFAHTPGLEKLFSNTSIDDQQQKLLMAMKLLVSNFRYPDVLTRQLKELATRHQGYGVELAHYEVFAEIMLAVMQDISGDAWNSETNEAWKEALDYVITIITSTYEDKTESLQPVPEQPQKETAQDHRKGDKNIGDERANAPNRRKSSAGGESNSIRVSIDKVDDLINMMGELVITQSMLSQIGEQDEFSTASIEKLRDGLVQLERNTREMQENVMRIRMLPISFAFQRFPRLVHDLSEKLGKKIELTMSGEQTELDKTVMEKIGDPLVHLVRNSLDHGIESTEVRLAAGKPETGTIHLNAYHEGGNIVIDITDDGAGLNNDKIVQKAIANKLISEDENLSEEQIHDLIFNPGFSTSDVVSDVSGRGVGMDVVRRNIRALGGVVEIKSKLGEGSTFRIRLPLTLAILDGQSLRVGKEVYILSLVSIIESIQVKRELINGVVGQAEVYRLREEYIPIVRLYDVFGVIPDSRNLENGLLVIVEGEGQKVALFVDDLLGQQQVVIKSLETNFRKIEGISGATILGDGTVALILDITGLIHLSKQASFARDACYDNDESVAA